MKLEHIIAGLLVFGSNNGYGLKKILDKEWRFFRKLVHLSQVYRTLKSMEEEGWVTSRLEPRDKLPDLRIYALTNTGFKMLIDWLSEDQAESGFRFQERNFVSKVYFMGLLDDPSIILRQLESELAFRRRQIMDHRKRERYLSISEGGIDLDEPKMWYFLDLVHGYGSGAMDYYVEWLSSTIEKIKSRYSL